jgi:hypothetical protein
MTDGGYEDEFDDTSIFENKSGLAEVGQVQKKDYYIKMVELENTRIFENTVYYLGTI